MRELKLVLIAFNSLIFLFSSVAQIAAANDSKSIFTISLNGVWDMGTGRNYNQKVTVPGIHTDPTMMNPEKLWYKKEVVLPDGIWKFATLELRGARFSPEVYVNGNIVSKANGGMAPTFHLLKQVDVKPGEKIVLEIALTSLKDLQETDASYIPRADQWRSNISSCLWNDAVLKFHGNYRIDNIIPFIDYNSQKADISFEVSTFGLKSDNAVIGRIEILDDKDKMLFSQEKDVSPLTNKITIQYGDVLKPWSPEHPNLYKLKLSLIEGKDTIDQSVIPFGVKDFRVKNKQFYLNGQPITLLGGTVVWHRWMRDEEARCLGYDTKWFTKNVIHRLKEHGANYIRFHLGVPPESFLDLCDQYGLAVQYEWSFFHGMPASFESLLEQYSKWLDMAMRHPSIVIFHPYNETEGEQLKTVWNALDSILKNYPPLVLEERDVIHIHKYWWSLFENLGLYYDDANQFSKAIMVDEFGGNYLDGEGMMGEYPSTSEAFLRFLGRNHTKESRLAFQALANGKVAEYWRRIGAAGVAPFCVLGSSNDGSHWFLGKLTKGKPKPVWDALTCAWSPRSVSLEIWDRNFSPGQEISIPIYLFNNTKNSSDFNIRLTLKDSLNKNYMNQILRYRNVDSFSTQIKHQKVNLPLAQGKYMLSAELLNPPVTLKYPVISKWDINIFRSAVPEVLLNPDFSVAADEPEIIQFLNEHRIQAVPLSNTSSNIILLSINGWKKIASGDQNLLGTLEQAIIRGTSVILLDVGERYLGQGYPKDKGDLGPLPGVVTKTNTPRKVYNLFGGIKLTFNEVAEPESHIHPDFKNAVLWKGIPLDYTWLWNGMRGGLIVPATNIEYEGLSSSGFLEQWVGRGADKNRILNEQYFAYELEGFYEFSSKSDDNETKTKLKNKINFLLEDAPSLANSLNPNAPIKVTDLSKTFNESQNRMGENLIPLVNAGKNLTRTPVVQLNFKKNEGKLIVSQLLTAGRLAKGFGEPGLYGIRFDEVTNQFVLNMMEAIVKD